MVPSSGPPPPRSLRDYALLADGERGALVGPCGDLVWLCVPRWDSDAVFAALIGGPGWYRIAPDEPGVRSGWYEEGSLIWRGRWTGRTGSTECRQALAYPADPHRAVVLRQVRAVDGPVRTVVSLQLSAAFGDTPVRGLRRAEDGSWTARAAGLHLRWSGAPGARVEEEGGRPLLSAELRLEGGGVHDLVLECSDRPLGPPESAHRLWRATEDHWRERVPDGFRGALGARDARLAYAVLRGMTGTDGGTVAAATTSLPEGAEQGRNYDYRYVWIRDLCYVGQAVAAAGHHPLLDDTVRFLTARLLEHGARLRPAYTSAGGPVPGIRRLDLPGYPGGYDVVGNRVNRQFQLDVFGEALLLLAAAARHDALDDDGRRAVRIAADAIAERHVRPDAGIWELRDAHWTHSRLICAAGLRAAASDCAAGAGRAARWAALADHIVARTAAEGLHPSGRWQRSPDDPGCDAALLLPALRGAVSAADPRSRATVRAVAAELGRDHYLYRFRHDDRPLGDAEGAFLLCGFLMALAEHQQGRPVEAVRWFERNRAACGPPGLYAEEFDIVRQDLRGNLPQAFVHALLLESAVRLAEPPGGGLGGLRAARG
ncbi:glycoside hydrolase family 15 protein [Streptomyces sp. NPDC046557]|uniref:glycoside hydrolase family 15 protein n=1 Tax=Streptomyces sp. NPDC046557 TaxID=3155372 RepID=UPI0033D4A773